MAEAQGGSAARLGEHSKLQAFYNELLKKTDEAVSALGPKFNTLEDVITQGGNHLARPHQ